MAAVVTFKIDEVSRFVYVTVRELKLFLEQCSKDDLRSLGKAAKLAHKVGATLKAKLIETRMDELVNGPRQKREAMTQARVDEAVAAFMKVYGRMPKDRHLQRMLHIGGRTSRRFDVSLRKVKVGEDMLQAARDLKVLSPEEVLERKSLAGKAGYFARLEKERGAYRKDVVKRVAPKGVPSRKPNPQAEPTGAGWFWRKDYGRGR